MNITILGSGNVGSALGAGLQKAGHSITFGVRNPDSVKSEKAAALVKGALFKSVAGACADADVIIITTPPEAVLQLLPEMGDVKNKILVDATNSVRTRPEPYPTAFHALKEKTGSQRVVKCFNSTGFENMLNPVYPGFGGIDMFCAGSDKESKALVQKLAKEIGFGECWDFGGDDKVELLEKFALSWINLAIMQGHGRNLAFKVISR
jgi:predicted dinucleotide-binding enzyme